jgi:phosphoribosylglycinamide formyltransferase-1
VLSLVVLISGSGSNLRALLDACQNPMFPVRVLAVGSDKPASGLEHAELFGIPTFVVEPGQFGSREEWARALAEQVKFMNPDLVLLAGFMKVLPESFVSQFYPRIINMHPSLLPNFPGAHAVSDALSAGASTTGATIHIVDAGVDTGPVVSQREIAVRPGVSEPELQEEIKSIEREQLVLVIEKIAKAEIKLEEIAP